MPVANANDTANLLDCRIMLQRNDIHSSIATCILVMAKNKTENKILFIDASKEFKKETNNNILEEKNIDGSCDFIVRAWIWKVHGVYAFLLAFYDDVAIIYSYFFNAKACAFVVIAYVFVKDKFIEVRFTCFIS